MAFVHIFRLCLKQNMQIVAALQIIARLAPYQKPVAHLRDFIISA